MSDQRPQGPIQSGPPLHTRPDARMRALDPAVVDAAAGKGAIGRAVEAVRRWVTFGGTAAQANAAGGGLVQPEAPGQMAERPVAPSEVRRSEIAPPGDSQSFFGPGTPLPPIAPHAEAAGRAFDFQVGFNATTQPRRFEPISFTTLRALAEYDLVRLAIETRKDQLVRVRWSILPKRPPGQKHASPADAECEKLEKFFSKPDGIHGWEQWLRAIAEDSFVLDGVALYRRRTRGGEPYALEQVDASTINLMIDKTGRRPLPPHPAYQQILKGVPATEYTSDELTYAMRNPRPGKAYGLCYSSDTEILTRRGWVLFAHLTKEDEVATRNPTTKEFEWQRPTAIITEQYSGEMYHFASRAVDLLVTPDHRMLVTSTPRALGGGAQDRWKVSGEALIPAKDLAPHLNHSIKIPMTSLWRGVEVQAKTFALELSEEVIEVERRLADGSMATFSRRRGRGSEKPLTISGDDYCALLGAYLAEGNIRAQGGLEIAQCENSKGFGPFASLIARIMGGPAQHNGRAFVLPRRGLTAHFRQFGRAPEKFIPDDVMNAPLRQLRIFWDHFVLGDGCFEARPNVSGRGSRGGAPAITITTVSEKLAGQLQEIAQKLGWSASVYRRRTGGPAVIMGRSCNTLDSFKVSVRYSQAMAVKAIKETYDGTIHCVSVPNRVVYVRRNGKPAWCGNSPVEQIVTYISLGLRRVTKQLQTYTDGNIPESLISVPESWTVQQIQQFQIYWDSVMENPTVRRKARFVPAGMNYYPTHSDGQIYDQFDEWLARVVAYAFSLPPTPFVRQQNRATAESAYETALEEGLEPTLQWLKRLIDNEIEHFLGKPGYELVWDNIRTLNPQEQQQVDLADIRAGVKSIDEVREGRGDPPIGLPHIIWGVGPLGFMSVDAMKKAIQLGLDMPQPPPPPDMGMGGIPGEDPLAGASPELLAQLGLDQGQGQPQGMQGQGGNNMQQGMAPPPNPLLAGPAPQASQPVNTAAALRALEGQILGRKASAKGRGDESE